ncbi:thiamine pyrophosphate-binding protein [Orrella marina]|uniref:Thiamine pyrophosphate-binding protein n=1 Tax=Orrella marina TaxID=2163011 RepID=A0A2R4XGR0_9BURK|nr:thiamine pyrophosphate-binding protein [Orrella marina]AWB33006.1 hypothetical protein DBV39_03935 [Orrella marina]
MSSAEVTKTVKGYERIAGALVEAGVECIFGVLGDDTGPLIMATSERGIRYIYVRHENQAVAMADGYSRSTGRIGVATVTGGPGFSNSITAINSAHRGKSRVCVLVGTGNVAEDDLAPGMVRSTPPASWLKFFPQSAVLDTLGIVSVKPETVATAWQQTRYVMQAASAGTVVLILPRDVLEGNLDPESEETDLGFQSPSQAPVDQPSRSGERSRIATEPSDESICAIADLLQETWAINRPLILAGRGALDAGAAPALRRLGELTGALMATTLPANALFHDDPFNIGICGTYATPVASELIPQADCVLVFGAGLNALTTYKNTLFPKAMVIQVDTDPSAFGRFLDVEVAVAADTRLTAERLVAELEKRAHQAQGFRDTQTRQAIAGFKAGTDVHDKSGNGLIDPRVLMIELDRLLPSGRILCADGGQQARFAIRYVSVSRERNFMQASDAGSIGLGMGIGIGAAIARPNEIVMVAIGDASMMMALGDLETAIRLRLPMLVVISNDEALGSEVNFLSEQGLPTDVALTPNPSFAAIAQSMGAQAATIRSPAELEVAERWLQDGAATVLVLDCRINPDIRAHFVS